MTHHLNLFTYIMLDHFNLKIFFYIIIDGLNWKIMRKNEEFGFRRAFKSSEAMWRLKMLIFLDETFTQFFSREMATFGT